MYCLVRFTVIFFLSLLHKQCSLLLALGLIVISSLPAWLSNGIGGLQLSRTRSVEHGRCPTILCASLRLSWEMITSIPRLEYNLFRCIIDVMQRQFIVSERSCGPSRQLYLY